jgi:hypothetical protein
MKKFIAIGILALAVFQSTAQFSWGFVGGGVYSQNSLKTDNYSSHYQDIILYQPYLPGNYYDATTRTGTLHPIYSYFGGLVFEYMISHGFGIRSKVLLQNNGWRETFQEYGRWNGNNADFPEERSDSLFGKETYRLSYISVPITFLIKPTLRKVLLSIGVGPYINYGLIGIYGVKFSQNTFQGIIRDSVGYISFNSDTSMHRSASYDAKRIDFGMTLSAGIEFRSGFFIEVSYNYGLTNVLINKYGYIDWQDHPGSVMEPNQNRSVNFGVGYFIHRKKSNSTNN